MTSAASRAQQQASAFWFPLRGLLFMTSRPIAFRRFLRAAAVFAAASAAVLALTFALLFQPQYNLLYRVLGHSWLAFQVASGAVLLEASWPLFLLLQFRQSDLSDSLFADTLREVGAPHLSPLPPDERAELTDAALALQRQRAAAVTGAASPCTAPLLLLSDLFVGRPGESRLRSWLRLTASSPLLVFWPYGPVAYAWLNGYATGVAVHAPYLKAKGVTDREQQEAVAASRSGQYRAFGAAAMLLSLVPIVGWGLSLCSSAGAALWAAELEGASGKGPSKLYQGGVRKLEDVEYGLVSMEEAR